MAGGNVGNVEQISDGRMSRRSRVDVSDCEMDRSPSATAKRPD